MLEEETINQQSNERSMDMGACLWVTGGACLPTCGLAVAVGLADWVLACLDERPQRRVADHRLRAESATELSPIWIGA
ncbi:hypothetical protein GQ457_06G016250 [Hibiscus cannabinus]